MLIQRKSILSEIHFYIIQNFRYLNVFLTFFYLNQMQIIENTKFKCLKFVVTFAFEKNKNEKKPLIFNLKEIH